MDCPSIPQLEYGLFSEQFVKKISSQRIPISGSIEVTTRCNLVCQHCYLPPELRKDRIKPELTRLQLERIIGEVADAGCLWLLLTGGEIFLRPDFLEIYRFAKGRGLILTIFTNGTLITERIADFLAEWRPFKVEITLYGATQATYEKVTSIPGSYARCRRGIELLAERRIPFSLKTMVMTLNHHELEEMRAFADSLGVKFAYDPIINAAVDGDSRPAAFRLSPEEVVSLESQDPIKQEHWPDMYASRAEIKLNTKQMFLCGAGRQSFFVDAAGRLSLCLVARQPSYDLLAGSFREGWDYFFPPLIAREHDDTHECAACSLRTTCAQCPAFAYLEYGDPGRRVEYACQIAKLRNLAFSPQNRV